MLPISPQLEMPNPSPKQLKRIGGSIIHEERHGGSSQDLTLRYVYTRQACWDKPANPLWVNSLGQLPEAKVLGNQGKKWPGRTPHPPSHRKPAKISSGPLCLSFWRRVSFPTAVFFLLCSPKGSRWFSNYSKERPENRKREKRLLSTPKYFLFPKKSFLTYCLVVSPRLLQCLHLLPHAVSFWSFMGYTPLLGCEVPAMLPTIGASTWDPEPVGSKGRGQAPKS